MVSETTITIDVTAPSTSLPAPITPEVNEPTLTWVSPFLRLVTRW